MLVNEGGVTDVEVLCAALLHDTVEDTDTTPQEIEGAFGARVARIVAEVTDDQALSKSERKRLQVERAAGLSSRRSSSSSPTRSATCATSQARAGGLGSCPPARVFRWAKRVVDGLRGGHAGLEAAFDAAYAMRK